jgi:hypothetical protein
MKLSMGAVARSMAELPRMVMALKAESSPGFAQVLIIAAH